MPGPDVEGRSADAAAVTQASASPKLSDLLQVPGYDLVSGALTRVEERLASFAKEAVEPLPEVTAHLIGSGGKRFRPLVLLLSAGAAEIRTEALVPMACAAELMHSATLLHDDVVDEAETRRGRPAAHNLWGNALSVLAGDYCLGRGLTELTRGEDIRPVQTLSKTVVEMAEGEVIQLMGRGRLDLSTKRYYEIVERKTASLMSWCARVAGLLPPEVDAAMDTYGRAVGLAFQIADDILDYQGDTAVTGKGLGADLREGKATLPLIEACRLVPDLESRLRSALQAPADAVPSHLTTIARQVVESGAIEPTRAHALRAARQAQQALEPLERNPCYEALHQLAHYSADRIA